MKHLDFDLVFSAVERNYVNSKRRVIAFAIFVCISSLFSFASIGYVVALGYLPITLLVLINFKKKHDTYVSIKNHIEEYHETGKYHYSEKYRLSKIIDAEIKKRNRHILPAVISPVLSILFIVVAAKLGGDLLHYLSVTIYMASMLYLLYFLIFLLPSGIKYARIKKKYDLSLYEDIYVEFPSTVSKAFYCGEKALFYPFGKKLVPYESIDKIEKSVKITKDGADTIKITEISIYADGKRVLKTQCNPIDIAWLICECIKPINPNVVIEGY